MNANIKKTRNANTKVHYKMYKAGKRWLFAGIAVVALGGGVVLTNGRDVAASTDGDANAQTTDVIDGDAMQQHDQQDQQSGFRQAMKQVLDEAGTPANQSAVTTPQPPAAAAPAPASVQPSSETDQKPANEGTGDQSTQTTTTTTPVNSPVNDVQGGPKSADPEPAADTDATTEGDQSAQTTTTTTPANSPVNDGQQGGPKSAEPEPVVDEDDVHVEIVQGKNAGDLFKNNGVASTPDNNGKFTIVSNHPQTDMYGDNLPSQGAVMMANRINMSHDFKLEATVSLGDDKGADGLGIGLYGGSNLKETGKAGGAMGIGGLEGAFGFKLDTYANTESNSDLKYNADPVNKIEVGKALGGFMYTDKNKNNYETTDTTSGQESAAPKLVDSKVGQKDAEGNNDNAQQFKMSYTADGTTMTVQFGDETWTRDISDWLKDEPTNDDGNQYLSLFAAASTGAKADNVTFQLNKLTYTPQYYVDLTVYDQNNQVVETDVNGDRVTPRVVFTAADGNAGGVTYTIQKADVPGYAYQSLHGETAMTGNLNDDHMTTTLEMNYLKTGAVHVINKDGSETVIPYAVSHGEDAAAEDMSVPDTIVAPTLDQIQDVIQQDDDSFKDGIVKMHAVGTVTDDKGTVTTVDMGKDDKGGVTFNVAKAGEATSKTAVSGTDDITVSYATDGVVIQNLTLDGQQIGKKIQATDDDYLDKTENTQEYGGTGANLGEVNKDYVNWFTLDANGNLVPSSDPKNNIAITHDDGSQTVTNIYVPTVNTKGVDARKTAGYDREADVIAASKTYMDYINSLVGHPMPAAEDVQAALDAYQGAIKQAVTARQDAITQAGVLQALRAAVGKTDVPEVKKNEKLPDDQQKLVDIQATTEEIKTTIDTIGQEGATTDKLMGLNKQLEDQLLDLGELANESDLQKATAELRNNLHKMVDPDAAAGDKTSAYLAIQPYAQQVNAARAARKAAIDTVNAAINDAKTTNNEDKKPIYTDLTADEGALTQLIEDSTNAKENATTADLIAQAKTVQDKITAVDKATKDAETLLTGDDPMGGRLSDPTVWNAAKDYLDKLAADGKTTTDIIDAAGDLQPAIDAAQKARDTAVQNGKDAAAKVDPNVKNTEAIKDALKTLDDAIKDPKSSVATIEAAKTALELTESNAKVGNATETATTDALKDIQDKQAALKKAQEDFAKAAADTLKDFDGNPLDTKTVDDALKAVTQAEEDLKKSTDTAQETFTKVQTERTNLINTINGLDAGDVGNELVPGTDKTVAETIADLKQAAEDINNPSKGETFDKLNNAELDKALKAANDAITDAKTARQNAIDRGTDTTDLLDKATSKDLKDNTDLKQAIDDFNKAVTDAGDGKAKTADVQDAVDKLEHAVAEAGKTVKDHTALVGDDAVKESLENLDKSIKDFDDNPVAKDAKENPTVKAIIDNANLVVEKENMAEDKWNAKVDDAKDKIDNATNKNFTDVQDTINEINKLIEDGNKAIDKKTPDEDATPEKLQELLDKLTNTEKTIDDAKKAIDDIETAPYGYERDVQAAKGDVDDALNADRTTIANLNKAIDNLNEKVNDAKAERTADFDEGHKVIADLTGKDIADNAAVQKAINTFNKFQELQDAKDDQGKPVNNPVLTNFIVSEAVKNLKDTITTVQEETTKAGDQIGKTAPYTTETNVENAKHELEDALKNGTAKDIADKTTALQTAVDNAKTGRESMLVIGQNVIDGITDDQVKDNALVQAAIDNFKDQLTKQETAVGDDKTAATDIPGLNNNTVKDALQNLITTVKGVTNGVGGLKDVETAPYTEEANVKEAQTNLDKALKNGTGDEIAAKVADLVTAIADAAAARDKIISDGVKGVVNATTNGVANNTDVQDAIKNLEAAEKDAANAKNEKVDKANVTNPHLQDLVDQLNAAVTKATEAKTNATDAKANTAPYTKEENVAKAKTALENALDNGADTQTLAGLTKGLDAAIKEAAKNRDQIIADGVKKVIDATTNGVANNADVKKAIAELEAVEKDAANAKTEKVDKDDVTNAHLQELVGNLTWIVADAKDAKGKAEAVQTAPFGHETPVNEAKKDLDDAITGGAGTQEIEDKTKALKDTIDAAAKDRENIVDKGDQNAQTVKDKGVDNNADVKKAIDEFNHAKDMADKAKETKSDTDLADNGKLNDLANKINTEITKAESAKDGANNVKTAPYSSEQAVKDAKDKLDTAVNGNAGTAEIADLTDQLQKAVDKAAIDRGNKFVVGNALVNGILDPDIQNNQDVKAAIDSYTDLKDKQDAGQDDTALTTQTVDDAVRHLAETIQNATAAKSAAHNVVTAPFSKETQVTEAKNNLDQAIADGKDTDEIKGLTDKLNQAIDEANNTRDNIIGDGVKGVVNATTNGVANNADVQKAIDELEAAEKDAANAKDQQVDKDDVTNQHLQDLVDNLNAVVATAKDAKDKAEAVPTAPFGHETPVNEAKKDLDDAITNGAGTKEIEEKTKTLKNTIDAAAKDRENIVATGDKNAQNAKDKGVDNNADVKKAIDDFNHAKDMADKAKETGSDTDLADNGKLNDLANKINTEIAKAESAKDNANNVQTAPFSNETPVSEAKKNLDDAIKDGKGTAEITDLTDKLNQAIDKADGDRNQIIGDGVKGVVNATTNGVANNADVKQAIEELQAAEKDAANAKDKQVDKDGLTNQHLQDLVDNLNAVVAVAKDAKDKAEAVPTAPFGHETPVNEAKKDLDDAIKNGAGTKEIEEKTKTLKDTVDAAAKDRENIVNKGDQNAQTAKDKGVDNNADVKKAIDDFNHAKDMADKAKETGSDTDLADNGKLNDLANKINTEIAKAESAKDDANDVQTAPFSQETPVAEAKDALDKAIADGKGTAEIADLTDKLNQAVDEANKNRDGIIGDGVKSVVNAAINDVANNADVKKAIEELQAAEKDAANAKDQQVDKDGLTNQHLQDLVDNVNAVVAVAKEAKDKAEAVPTAPFGHETPVNEAKKDLDDAIKNGAGTKEIEAKTKTLKDTIDAAAKDRENIVAKGDQNAQTAKDKGVDNNADVQKAIDDFNHAKDMANKAKETGSDTDLADNGKLNDLANKINTEIAKAESAKDDANNVKTAPYGHETPVNEAKKNLDDAIKDGKGTAEITDLTDKLNKAIDEAGKNRDDILNHGDDSTKDAKDKGVDNNADVKKAIDDFNNAKDKANEAKKNGVDDDLADNGKLNDLANKIDTEIAKAESAKDDANKIQTAPYGHETPVTDAKQALDDAIKNGAGTKDIADLTDKLNEAIDKAAKDREAIVDNGTNNVETAKTNGVDNNADVKKAIDDFNHAKDMANKAKATGSDTDEADNKVLNDLAKKVMDETAKAKAAKDEANKVQTAPYGHETPVTDAKKALDDAIKNGADTETIKDLTDDLKDKIDTAKKDRGDILDKGDASTQDAKDKGVDNNADVKKAIDDFNKAKDIVDKAEKTKADTDIADNGKLDDLVKKIQDETDKAKKAVDDADDAKKNADPYTKEDYVNKAKDNLDKAIKDGADTKTVEKLTDDLNDKVDQAKKNHEDIIKSGDDSEKDAKDNGVDNNTDVKKAIKDYNDAKDKGDLDNKDLNDLAKKVKEETDKAKDAKDKANKVQTAPYGYEQPVIDAKKALDKALTDGSDTKTVEELTKDLEKKVAQAKKDRADIEDKGAKNIDDTKDVANNQDVQDAIDAYNAAKHAADKAEETKSNNKKATNDNLNKLADAVKDAADKAKAAVDDGNKVQTAPFGHEQTVIDAKKALDDAIKGDKTHTQDITDRTNDLKKAIDDAAKDRQDILDKGDKSTQDAKDKGVDNNADVKKAIDDFNKAKDIVDKAEKTKANTDLADNGKLDDLAKKIQDETDKAKTAIDNADDAKKNADPYTKEDYVKDAKDTLDKAIKDGADTKTVEKLTDDLNDKVDQAKKNHDDIVKSGDDSEKDAKDNGVDNNTDVEKAIKDFNDAKDKGDVNNKDLNDLAKKVKEETDKAKDAKDKANNVQTAPYGHEQPVIDAKQAVDDALKNGADTETIKDLTKDLQDKVDQAKKERQDIEDKGAQNVADTKDVDNNQDVQDAVDAYNAAKHAADTAEKTKSNNDKATNNNLDKLADAVKDAADKAKKAVDDGNKIQTAPYGHEQTVIDAKKALDDAIKGDKTHTQDIIDRTKDLEKAIDDAAKDRQDILDKGDKSTQDAKDKGVDNNADVKKAIDDFNAAKDIADKAKETGANTDLADNGKLDDLAKKVQEETDKAKKAIDDADDAKKNAEPYTKEDYVQDAKDTLDKAIDDGAGTDTINKLTDDLNKKVDQAKQNHDDIVKSGEDNAKDAKDKGVDNNADVKQAIDDFNNAKDTGDNKTLNELAKKVEEATDAAKDAKDNAENIKTAPYGDEPGVADVKTALDNAIANGAGTAEITDLTKKLNEELTKAEISRAVQTATGEGNIANAGKLGVTDDPAVQAAIKEFEDIVAKAEIAKANGTDAPEVLNKLIQDAAKKIADTAKAVRAARDEAARQQLIQDLLDDQQDDGTGDLPDTFDDGSDEAAKDDAAADAEDDEDFGDLPDTFVDEDADTDAQNGANATQAPAALTGNATDYAGVNAQKTAMPANVDAESAAKTDVDADNLPQTGNAKDGEMSLIGIAMASLLGIFGLAGKRRKEEDDQQ